MSLSSKQQEQFISSVISWDLLDYAVEWIGDNLEPEEVFSESSLEEWALNNGFVRDE